MSRKIQILRGEAADMPVLDVGEMAWVMDEQKLYIGDGTNAVEIPTEAAIEALNDRLDTLENRINALEA